ncbi:MAG: hypothetical protein HY809_05250 [Nitrospirae bacterium]|nr:hypothetical protein [Nitrospirota bacterium]
MTIDELKKNCEDEFKNIDIILQHMRSVYDKSKQEHTIAEQASIATFIINIYGGIEKVLKQMLVYDKLDIKDSPGWHETLLKKAGEIGILPPDLFQTLSNYLAFRNYFIYNYIFNIEWDDIRSLADAVDETAARLRREVDEYIQTI